MGYLYVDELVITYRYTSMYQLDKPKSLFASLSIQVGWIIIFAILNHLS